ncbi:Zinc knuckle [Emericellopsis cladophorae]|uniref:Zinc knuckle n=1 Tax=Emericellopsis cladophorae TaxID=2686198 RepID=A0A9Q0BDN2_9HYPO|nr:Zinc knuckle [Emericellopsis cladophorae]KAI6781552.1 Zinc knuckle [Emericellopsis cladophorae]
MAGESSKTKGKHAEPIQPPPEEDIGMNSDESEDEADILRGQIQELRGQLQQVADMQTRDKEQYDEAYRNFDEGMALQREQNAQLRNEINNVSNNTIRQITGKDPGEIMKPRQPGPFDSTTKDLQGFLTQVRAYQQYFPSILRTEEDKVRHAAGCLSGAALAWFEPTLRDFVTHVYQHRKQDTKDIFAYYYNFKEALKATFGTIDKERLAENQLEALKQKGSASDYSALFVQIASRTTKSEGDKIAAYYKGLKDEVKDKLYKEDRPAALATYIAIAVKIDNRQFERRQQKRGQYFTNSSNRDRSNKNKIYPNIGRPRFHLSTAHGGTHAGPMDLDAIQRKLAAIEKKNLTCYSYGKKGHFAREYHSQKKERKQD